MANTVYSTLERAITVAQQRARRVARTQYVHEVDGGYFVSTKNAVMGVLGHVDGDSCTYCEGLPTMSEPVRRRRH